MAKITGKAGIINVGLVSIPFRKITPSVSRIVQPTTDSTCYDPISGLTWPSQKPIMAPVSFMIDGLYDTIKIPNAVTFWLLTGLTAVPCSIYFRGGLLFGTGNFDVVDFKLGIPFDDVCDYSFTAISNGPFGAVYFF